MATATLISAIFDLADSGGRFTSHNALAWFLHEVHTRDAALAASLHEANDTRPFTVWAGTYDELGGAVPPAADGAEALVRVTSVLPAVTDVVRDLVKRPPQTIRLGARERGVLAATADHRRHALARTATAAQLVAEAADAADDRRVTIHFLTPTAFGGRPKQLFPLADRVFGSVLAVWNEAVPRHAVPPEIAAPLQRSLQVEAHYLATRLQRRSKSAEEKGFVGWCEYGVAPATSPAVRAALQLLARAATFTGIGGRTTMGMGQALFEKSSSR